jgi:hypothetical protein
VVPRISSLSDKVLSAIDKATDNVLKDFKADCRILHPNIYSNYVKKYSDSGHKAAQAFVTQLWEMADRFIGYEGMTPAIKEHPLFEAVQSYVYPSNGARDYESLAHCLDRTEDLELFEIPSEAITVNLGDAPTISLRKGLSAEPSIASSVENLIRNTIRLAESPARLEATLQEQLARFGYDAEQQEPHMGIVDLLEQVAAGDLKSHQIKKLLITYHAWIHQDFKQYAADSVDRANQAQNRDYAYLLELQQFLTTDVVDSLTRAIRSTESQDKAHEATLISIATNVFTQEIESLKRELSKYIAQDSSGNQVRTIEAFFLKDRPSARMRDTAGLCVAEDNPSSVSDNSQRNIWDMENYFQLVLKDIESRRCIGGVLLHYYEEQNLRILTASINPSSTFLYKVDEDMLFKRIVGILADFAEANDIDVIGVSTEPEIRTNRTGGLFEQALNTQIRLVHERLSLKNPEPFSYTPDYKQQHLDVIWRRGDNLK